MWLALLLAATAAPTPVRAAPTADGHALVCWPMALQSQLRVLTGPAGATTRDALEVRAELDAREACWRGPAEVLDGAVAVVSVYPSGEETAPTFALRSPLRLERSIAWRDDPPDSLHQLLIGEDGSLWAHGGDTLARLDMETGRWLHHDLGDAKRGTTCRVDHRTRLSVEALELRCGNVRMGYDPLAHTWSEVPAPAPEARWSLDRGGLYRETAEGERQRVEGSPTGARALFEQRDGGVIVDTGALLARLDPEGRWRYAPRTPDLFIDSQGRAWSGTWEGIQRWRLPWSEDPEALGELTPEGDPVAPEGPIQPRFRRFAEDAEGRLWVAASGYVARYDPRDGAWWTDFSAAPPKRAEALYADPAGGVLVRHGRTLTRLDPATGAWQHYVHGRGPPEFIGRDREGALWIQGRRGGVARYDGARWQDFPELTAARVLPAQEGLAYAASKDALRLIHPDGRSEELPRPDDKGPLRQATLDDEGRLLVLTLEGLYRWDGEAWTPLLEGRRLSHALLEDGALIAWNDADGLRLGEDLEASFLGNQVYAKPLTTLPSGGVLVDAQGQPLDCDPETGRCEVWRPAHQLDEPWPERWSLVRDADALYLGVDGRRLVRWTQAEGWSAPLLGPAPHAGSPAGLAWGEGPRVSTSEGVTVLLQPETGSWRRVQRRGEQPGGAQVRYFNDDIGLLTDDGAAWCCVDGWQLSAEQAPSWSELYFGPYRFEATLWVPDGGQAGHGPTGALWVLTRDALLVESIPPGEDSAPRRWPLPAFDAYRPPPPVSDGRRGAWRATEGGLVHDKRRRSQAVPLPGLPAPLITHLVRDPESGWLWMGVRGAGLVAFHPRSGALEILGLGFLPSPTWRPWVVDGRPTGAIDGLYLEGERVVIEQGDAVFSAPRR